MSNILWRKYSFFLLVVGFCSLTSCNNQPTETVVDETTVEEIPNLSDVHFEEALQSFKNGKNKEATSHIQMGITELQVEAGKNLINKSAFNKAVAALKTLAADIQADKIKDTDRLREVFANAALTVSHDYLVTEDIYVLEKPTKVSTNKLHKAFDKAEQSFNTLVKDASGETKKAAAVINAETLVLRQKEKELEAAVSAHLKKMRDYVKSHHPGEENNFPYYEF